MGVTINQLIKLTKSLYPTGRVYNWKEDSVIGKIHKALATSEQDLTIGADQILISILADSDAFTEEMAALWEDRLAIDASPTTSLEDRKSAILRKYSHPGTQQARQHYLYMEGQLQSAGFDVYVHENRPVAQNPTEFPNLPSYALSNLGSFQLGQAGLGGTTPTGICANYIDEVIDSRFSLGSDFRHLFFVGAEIKGDLADVSADRKKEFRKLILSLKPVQTVGILFVNYV